MVEEDQYRDTYQRINQRRCVFEKAINSRRCACEQCRRFFLADREGIACESDAGARRCAALLKLMREKARFSLQLTRVAGPLPHNKEIRVQSGGLLGLQRLVMPELAPESDVKNVYGLLSQAETRFGSLQQFPYTEIAKGIASFEGRRRRPRRG